jgi:two-component system, OmpR family, aerobic respiration control sensor histidine kinase ArcB
MNHNDLIQEYDKKPTVNTLISSLLVSGKFNFILISWCIKEGTYYIPVLYDAKIDKEPLYIEKYVYSEPDKDHIPIRHSVLVDLKMIKAQNSIFIYDGEIDELYLTAIKYCLISLSLNDLVKRSKSRHELTLSNICHSVRTPLNGILNFTNLLMNKTDSISIDDIILNLNNEAITLANNIFDIVDLTQLELGKIKLNHQTFNLHDVINQAIKIVNMSIISHIEETVPKIVYADEKRIQQSIISILDNANKRQYMSSSIILFVSADFVDTSNELEVSNNDKSHSTTQYCISFIVKDNGIPIDEKTKEFIFKPIELTANDKQQAIGLRVAYLLAKLLNGVLALKYSDIKETCIRLDICLEEDIESIKETKNLNILIVEDEKNNQIVLDKLLHSIGYNQLTIVSTGRDALNKLSMEHYDLILLDIRLPDLSGFEIAKHVKGLYKSIKIICVTAQALFEDNVDDFDDIIYKPVNAKELGEKLSKL